MTKNRGAQKRRAEAVAPAAEEETEIVAPPVKKPRTTPQKGQGRTPKVAPESDHEEEEEEEEVESEEEGEEEEDDEEESDEEDEEEGDSKQVKGKPTKGLAKGKGGKPEKVAEGTEEDDDNDDDDDEEEDDEEDDDEEEEEDDDGEQGKSGNKVAKVGQDDSDSDAASESTEASESSADIQPWHKMHNYRVCLTITQQNFLMLQVLRPHFPGLKSVQFDPGMTVCRAHFESWEAAEEAVVRGRQVICGLPVRVLPKDNPAGFGNASLELDGRGLLFSVLVEELAPEGVTRVHLYPSLSKYGLVMRDRKAWKQLLKKGEVFVKMVRCKIAPIKNS